MRRLSEARLAAAWLRGRRHRLPPEPGNVALVELAHALQARSCAEAAGRLAGGPHRVLLCTPPSLAGEAWFGDLAQGLAHMGVPCLRLLPEERLTREHLEGFAPTVVVALDHLDTLRRIDLVALRRHHEDRGCLRVFVPTRTDLFAGGALDAEERARLEAAVRGDTADAYLSLYEPELFASHFADWRRAGFDYVSLPQSANPLQDTARHASRSEAWGFCSVNNPARLASVASLRPLLARHAGEWGGVGWPFGRGAIPMGQMPAHFARCRVVLAPLVGFLCEHPAELTHRVFEAAACGAFQVTCATPITRRFFPEEALVAVAPARFADEVESWLLRPSARDAVAERALRHVYAHHTVFHRVQSLVDWLERLLGR